MKHTNKVVLLTILLASTSASAHAAGDIQHKMLFTPSDYLLKAEARGRVMIYDGLKSETIDKAMDDQFDRIDKMMFVRSLYPQENGEYKLENDSCDD